MYTVYHGALCFDKDISTLKEAVEGAEQLIASFQLGTLYEQDPVTIRDEDDHVIRMWDNFEWSCTEE